MREKHIQKNALTKMTFDAVDMREFLFLFQKQSKENLWFY